MRSRSQTARLRFQPAFPRCGSLQLVFYADFGRRIRDIAMT
jgi:hypothetical protein